MANGVEGPGTRTDEAQTPPVALDVAQLLRALPKERLVDILAGETNPRDLGQRVAELRGATRPPRELRRALFGLTSDQLAALVLALGTVDDERAWREYREYRFTARPSLYLRAIPGTIEPARLECAALEQHLRAALDRINLALTADAVDPPAKGFELQEVRADDGLIEFTYLVQHRVDLVQRDLRPRIEYTVALGVVWLDAETSMCLINAARGTDANHLGAALGEALGVDRVDPVTLTDALLDQIVEEDNIRSGAFARAGEDGAGPYSVRYGDVALASHSSYAALRAGNQYRPTYAYYRLESTLPELPRDLGVGLTRRAGHLWIPYPLSRTELVAWARWLMRAVSQRQAHLLATDVAAAVAAREGAIIARLPAAWNRPGMRWAVLALLPPLAACLRDGLERSPLGAEPVEVARALERELLAVRVEGTCEACSADVLLTCPRCGETRFKIGAAGDSLVCRRCGAALDLAPLPTIGCECGGPVPLDAAAQLTLFPSGNLIDGLGTLLQAVDADLDLRRHAFVVEGREVRLLRDRAAPRVLRLEDIAEFGRPGAFGDYPEPVRQAARCRLTEGEASLEKCAPTRDPATGRPAWPCERCSPRPHPERECLRTIVVDRVGAGKIEPHTGVEIADLVFDATVDGRQVKVLAFGKRMKHPGGELRSTNNEGRELMAQVWQWHDKDTFDVIAVLSADPVAQNLRIALEDMARYGRKSVLYLAGPEVERLLAANIACGTDRGPAGPTGARVVGRAASGAQARRRVRANTG